MRACGPHGYVGPPPVRPTSAAGLRGRFPAALAQVLVGDRGQGGEPVAKGRGRVRLIVIAERLVTWPGTAPGRAGQAGLSHPFSARETRLPSRDGAPPDLAPPPGIRTTSN